MGDRQPSDGEIIRRCRDGEVEPFSLLVQRYQDRVYNLALRLLGNPDDALDAAQDSFIRAFTALDRFDLERPLAPWLFRIVTNTCYGMLRKRRPDLSFDGIGEAEPTVSPMWAPENSSSDPQQALLTALRDEELQQAVLRLTEPSRTVVLLRYMDGMSYEAIAMSLDMPLGTVKTHLHRAHQRLRQVLSENEESGAAERHDMGSERKHGL